ncbi:MAG: OmpA family protein [Myxococcota bacterium]|nr:OmpA family protein [Myxococcota bacterium]
MKTITLAFVLAAALGCTKKPNRTTTPTAPQPTTAVTEQQPAPSVTGDQQVSPTLAVSGDIIAACGIKVAATSGAPKFDYDKEELAPEDRTVLDAIATCLMTGALKGRTVSLIGRADPRGTEEYNLGLGSRRAGTVSAYLSRLGVSQPQLAVTTRGALDAAGTDESGWQQDRRVDIQLQPQG